MKGKAREATVDMTAQSTARQASCSPVNRCIRSVRTWARSGVGAGRGLCPPHTAAPDTAPQPPESLLCPARPH